MSPHARSTFANVYPGTGQGEQSHLLGDSLKDPSVLDEILVPSEDRGPTSLGFGSGKTLAGNSSTCKSVAKANPAAHHDRVVCALTPSKKIAGKLSTKRLESNKNPDYYMECQEYHYFLDRQLNLAKYNSLPAIKGISSELTKSHNLFIASKIFSTDSKSQILDVLQGQQPPEVKLTQEELSRYHEKQVQLEKIKRYKTGADPGRQPPAKGNYISQLKQKAAAGARKKRKYLAMGKVISATQSSILQKSSADISLVPFASSCNNKAASNRNAGQTQTISQKLDSTPLQVSAETKPSNAARPGYRLSTAEEYDLVPKGHYWRKIIGVNTPSCDSQLRVMPASFSKILPEAETAQKQAYLKTEPSLCEERMPLYHPVEGKTH